MKYPKLYGRYLSYFCGDTKCAECGTVCQGIKDPRGKLLCPDCYKKIWG